VDVAAVTSLHISISCPPACPPACMACFVLPWLPIILGAVLVVRQLLGTRDGRKIVKTYNKVVRTLVAFECVWYDAWVAQIPKAKAGLYATLIVRHPTNRRLHVNFDPGRCRA
jgi:hypothetical protein